MDDRAAEEPATRPELLFSLELGDRLEGRGVDTSLRASDARERLRYLTSTRSLFECRLLRDVRAFLAAIVREDGKADAVVLASKLATVGYQLTIRTALGGGTGRSCFHNLHHEFLLVMGDPEFGTPQDKEFIVDHNFREQFSIPQATPAYEAMVQQLPSEFVGPASRLVPLVQLLCAEMSHAFEARSMTCPPWRQAKAMLSKWLPAKARDVDVASVYAKDAAYDSLSPGMSPRTPLEFCRDSCHAVSPLTPISNSETSRSMQAWWSRGPNSSSSGRGLELSSDSGSGRTRRSCEESISSRVSSVKLERSTSLLSRGLASKASAGVASPQKSLAAKLQKAALDCFLSDEQPPIRRVKLNGLHSAATKLVAA